jgi:hypothetical protein
LQEELRKKNRQIFLLGFQCVAKIYNDNNQRIFYFTFGWMIATLATNKIIPKKRKAQKIWQHFTTLKKKKIHVSRSG